MRFEFHINVGLAGRGHVRASCAEQPSPSRMTLVHPSVILNRQRPCPARLRRTRARISQSTYHTFASPGLQHAAIRAGRVILWCDWALPMLRSNSLTVIVAVLLINAIAILSEDRFLARSMASLPAHRVERLHIGTPVHPLIHLPRQFTRYVTC
jgi:hypothetical protein